MSHYNKESSITPSITTLLQGWFVENAPNLVVNVIQRACIEREGLSQILSQPTEELMESVMGALLQLHQYIPLYLLGLIAISIMCIINSSCQDIVLILILHHAPPTVICIYYGLTVKRERTANWHHIQGMKRSMVPYAILHNTNTGRKFYQHFSNGTSIPMVFGKTNNIQEPGSPHSTDSGYGSSPQMRTEGRRGKMWS
ncbi:hypothetical protein FRB93_004293 [Tulasnella sp. JGI-2019a]|nr:hypothetical protein FRB93_004293 [Tulasnella sp. JGI-2019a]